VIGCLHLRYRHQLLTMKPTPHPRSHLSRACAAPIRPTDTGMQEKSRAMGVVGCARTARQPRVVQALMFGIRTTSPRSSVPGLALGHPWGLFCPCWQKSPLALVHSVGTSFRATQRLQHDVLNEEALWGEGLWHRIDTRRCPVVAAWKEDGLSHEKRCSCRVHAQGHCAERGVLDQMALLCVRDNVFGCAGTLRGRIGTWNSLGR